MEQSRPAKLPFIALLMYFYVHVNTRANNGRCEWIYFSLVGKNMPPHDRNHWHNSQLPLFSTSLAANSNMPACLGVVAGIYCISARDEGNQMCGRGGQTPPSSRLSAEREGSSVNQRGPLSSFYVRPLWSQLCQGRRKCVSWKRQKGKRGQSWEGNAVALQLRFSFCVSWKWSAFRFHSEVLRIMGVKRFRGGLPADIIAQRHLARWIFAKLCLKINRRPHFLHDVYAIVRRLLLLLLLQRVTLASDIWGTFSLQIIN